MEFSYKAAPMHFFISYPMSEKIRKKTVFPHNFFLVSAFRYKKLGVIFNHFIKDKNLKIPRENV